MLEGNELTEPKTHDCEMSKIMYVKGVITCVKLT